MAGPGPDTDAPAVEPADIPGDNRGLLFYALIGLAVIAACVGVGFMVISLRN